MLKALPTLLLRMLALAGLAAVAALLANAQAAPARRLAWFGSILTFRPAVVEWARPPAPIASTTAAATTPASAPAPAVASSLPTKPLRPERPLPPQAPFQGAPAPPTPAEASVPNPIREISGAQAWEVFQQGVPFLDARRSAEFAEGHIAKAWSAPVWESDLEERLFAFKAARRPGPEDAIVIYCGGGDCRDSHLLAAKLLNEGYFHILIYPDGFPAWVAQGHPVEKGQP